MSVTNRTYAEMYVLLTQMDACDPAMHWLRKEHPATMREAVQNCPNLNWLDWAVDHMRIHGVITEADIRAIEAERDVLRDKLSHNQTLNRTAYHRYRISAETRDRNYLKMYEFHVRAVKRSILRYIEG